MAAELSVLVVSYNSRDCLEDCLISVEKERAGRPWEVLVVDNASADGSAGLVAERFPNAVLVRLGENVGFAAANNLGLDQCRGSFVLFLNPDTRVFPGALDLLLREMKADPLLGAAAPALLTGQASFQVSFGGEVHFFRELVQKAILNALWRRRLRRLKKKRTVAWASGACLMARRRAIELSGGFDEGFFLYFEDIDLCYRIRKEGFQVSVFPEARAYHAGGVSTSTSPVRSRLEYRRSQLHFYRKHNSKLSQSLLKTYLRLSAGLTLFFRSRNPDSKSFGRGLLLLLRHDESDSGGRHG